MAKITTHPPTATQDTITIAPQLSESPSLIVGQIDIAGLYEGTFTLLHASGKRFGPGEVIFRDPNISNPEVFISNSNEFSFAGTNGGKTLTSASVEVSVSTSSLLLEDMRKGLRVGVLLAPGSKKIIEVLPGLKFFVLPPQAPTEPHTPKLF